MDLSDEKYKALIADISEFTKKSVSEKRFAHSMRVAETAVEMSRLYGVDEKKAYLAGLAHDMCKKWEDEDLLSAAAEDGEGINDIERNKPSLLHGRAAAVLIQKKFDVTDPEIVQAIARHTMGCDEMCNLAKIIFAADKIEPGRPQSTDEYRRNLFSKSLDELVCCVLDENFRYLEKKGKSIAPDSLKFFASVKNSVLCR